MGQELTQIFDLDELLQTVAGLLRQRFDYQNVQVLWVDRENNTLEVRALVGMVKGKISLGATRPLDQGIARWVARHGQSVLFNDANQDSRYFAVPGFEASAELTVTVIVKDATVAVMNVDGRNPTSSTTATSRPW